MKKIVFLTNYAEFLNLRKRNCFFGIEQLKDKAILSLRGNTLFDDLTDGCIFLVRDDIEASDFQNFYKSIAPEVYIIWHSKKGNFKDEVVFDGIERDDKIKCSSHVTGFDYDIFIKKIIEILYRDFELQEKGWVALQVSYTQEHIREIIEAIFRGKMEEDLQASHAEFEEAIKTSDENERRAKLEVLRQNNEKRFS
ncbi:hypothetical protein [Capnocytophaga granulosa]|jgi:hypothetical protein|uniref:hypothetical protein n=1 Tax=Capnocytophaga granulosa TaxID=45242 RepID=UPI0028D0CAC5|nr:hypothetical protein [Capnocytophaga granulosa]